MTTLEKIGTGTGIVAFIFAVGAGWSTMNARLDRLDEKVESIENEKAQSLCIPIMTSEIKAVEKGNDAVLAKLQALEQDHCPQASHWENAAATRPATPEEIREQQTARQVKNAHDAAELSKLNDQLAAYIESH
jgi:hypothetical protein